MSEGTFDLDAVCFSSEDSGGSIDVEEDTCESGGPGKKHADENSYFFRLIDAQIPELSAEKPVVIFIDGASVTKDRKEHDLLSDEYGRAMIEAAEEMLEGVRSHLFQISDEISIIIYDVRLFAKKVKASYITHDEISSAVAQRFVPAFCKRYGKQVFFHIRVHNIEPGDCGRYTTWRRTYVRPAVYTYFAISENIWRGVYSEYSVEELITVFKRQKKYKKFIEKKRFAEGTEVAIPETQHKNV